MKNPIFKLESIKQVKKLVVKYSHCFFSITNVADSFYYVEVATKANNGYITSGKVFAEIAKDSI